jgi:hypothetical protein
MPSMLKSTILGIGLLAGTALAAQAQSVSSLPPNGAAPQSAATQPYASTQRIVPEPGGSFTWKGERYQPTADNTADRNDHPYSTSMDHAGSGGPAPN